MRPIHLVAIIVMLSSRAHADGLLLAWSPTDLEGMTEARWNKLDKTPAEPDSPARVCDTDFSANGYLKVVTAVPDQHPYDWWAAWWKTNGKQLKWSPDKGKFLTP